MSSHSFLPSQVDSGVTDIAIATVDLPWMETAPGIEMKPLQFWAASGQWAQLSRYQPGIRSDRHVHSGGQVMSYVIQGSWHYLEHDWVASAGSWVWEPPGDMHTLEILGDEPMEAIFILSGVVQYLDDDDQIVRQTDFRSRRRQYLDHCAEHGIEPIPIIG
jgi:2,4'-dihydroxyacetophenone dioxygenase